MHSAKRLLTSQSTGHILSKSSPTTPISTFSPKTSALRRRDNKAFSSGFAPVATSTATSSPKIWYLVCAINLGAYQATPTSPHT
ncbi:hypothetical protein KEM48_014157 [Puccinia striiformis f. sp. tritici PST-130]|nr:hypothetical protein KEM48_014157 [Puccinia striiformis f. sp. tritici PST-130]